MNFNVVQVLISLYCGSLMWNNFQEYWWLHRENTISSYLKILLNLKKFVSTSIVLLQIESDTLSSNKYNCLTFQVILSFGSNNLRFGLEKKIVFDLILFKY